MAKSVHHIIYQEILNNPSHFQKSAGAVNIHDIRSTLSFLFHNYRYSTLDGHQGLALSYPGHTILRKYFENYVMDRDDQISLKLLLNLDKKMIMPYYIGSTKIFLYSSQDYAWIQLCGGRLTEYLENL